MTSESLVRDAHADDVPAMAELADRKRRQYSEHASPFQRPAPNAREIHEGFLPKLFEWDGFEVLVHESGGEVDGFIVGRFGSAPPPFGVGSLFHVDDFGVAKPDNWTVTGRALLRTLAQRAATAGFATGIVVSGPSSVDAPKVSFLVDSGLSVAAEWWVKPVERSDAEPPEKVGFDAAVGPAPPVYDPGGPTALALRLDGPVAIAASEEFASASGAVVAIVPNFVSCLELRDELRHRGYTVASEWYSADTESLTDA